MQCANQLFWRENLKLILCTEFFEEIQYASSEPRLSVILSGRVICYMQMQQHVNAAIIGSATLLPLLPFLFMQISIQNMCSTSLGTAAGNGHKQVVERLLQEQVNINHQNKVRSSYYAAHVYMYIALYLVCHYKSILLWTIFVCLLL